MIISINRQNFQQEIQEAKKPVVIDVYAIWCGPCRVMMPLFEELAEELGASYVFAKLNVDEVREVAIHYGVTSVPTFIFVKNGAVVGKEIGSMDKEGLREKIEDLLG
ncbi:thioredoxin [Candidatus Dependentiae bacterium]|nr:thioredoxin [Candidatus Dependentiae bacterium]